MKLLGFTVEFNKVDFNKSVSTAKTIASVAYDTSKHIAKAGAQITKEGYAIAKEEYNNSKQLK